MASRFRRSRTTVKPYEMAVNQVPNLVIDARASYFPAPPAEGMPFLKRMLMGIGLQHSIGPFEGTVVFGAFGR